MLLTPRVPRTAARRGFTLVELLIVMSLLGVVGLAAVSMLRGTQRMTSNQAERSGVQQNTRAAALLIPAELREIDPTDPLDLPSFTTSTDTDIQYRAMRGMGVACQVNWGVISSGGAGTITLYDNPQMGLYSVLRTPAARDTLFIYSEGADVNSSADDSWVPLAITGVANATCPAASLPAGATNAAKRISVTLPTIGGLFPDLASLQTALNGVGLAVPGAPVRFYELYELGLYQQGADWWLGARSRSSAAAVPAFQPVLGPLLATNGLQFTFLQRDGTTLATVRSQIRAIRITVRGRSTNKVYNGLTGAPQEVQDSITTVVTFRNAPIP
ncbi:MAG TPA: prepilin-type N-terminal cleavage/methylation domain-containing protein [Gemmatimonadales bacterium]|nr:prepilin-type N-terminal cleavage/methylation domain-containing protein [Gemmatimonadales bacterium]